MLIISNRVGQSTPHLQTWGALICLLSAVVREKIWPELAHVQECWTLFFTCLCRVCKVSRAAVPKKNREFSHLKVYKSLFEIRCKNSKEYYTMLLRKKGRTLVHVTWGEAFLHPANRGSTCRKPPCCIIFFVSGHQKADIFRLLRLGRGCRRPQQDEDRPTT